MVSFVQTISAMLTAVCGIAAGISLLIISTLDPWVLLPFGLGLICALMAIVNHVTVKYISEI